MTDDPTLRARACRACGAAPGAWCRNDEGVEVSYVHGIRLDADEEGAPAGDSQGGRA